jgi:hypothetical protein
MVNPESLKNILVKLGFNNISITYSESTWILEYQTSSKRRCYLYPDYDMGVLISKIHIVNTKQELALVSINLVLPWNKNICIESADFQGNTVDVYYVQPFAINKIKTPIFNILIPYVINNTITSLNSKAINIAQAFNLLNYRINVVESTDDNPYEEEGLDQEESVGDLF